MQRTSEKEKNTEKQPEEESDSEANADLIGNLIPKENLQRLNESGKYRRNGVLV